MSKKTLIVEQRNVFGTMRTYPVCETAKLLASFANTKSFTSHHIKYLKKLGYLLEQKAVKL